MSKSAKVELEPINKAVTTVRPHNGVAEKLARREAYVHVHNVYWFLFKSHFNSWDAFVVLFVRSVACLMFAERLFT